MTFSEDEDLLNSDEGSEKEEKSLEKENSITAIISDGSSESEMSVEEEEDDEIAQGNARAFSDKDNQWIKLKKNMDDSEEEEEGDSEEEMVGNGRCFVIAQNDFEKEAEEDESNQKLIEKEANENIADDLKKEDHVSFSKEDGDAVYDLNELKERIQDIVTCLSDFRRKRDPALSREDYMDRLKKDCAKFYG